jgi:hypothetical protein
MPCGLIEREAQVAASMEGVEDLNRLIPGKWPRKLGMRVGTLT